MLMLNDTILLHVAVLTLQFSCVRHDWWLFLFSFLKLITLFEILLVLKQNISCCFADNADNADNNDDNDDDDDDCFNYKVLSGLSPLSVSERGLFLSNASLEFWFASNWLCLITDELSDSLSIVVYNKSCCDCRFESIRALLTNKPQQSCLC